ncbi:MAG: DUF819 family protein [Bacteroidales bacterium]|jgi:uncharacterized membrane protein
MTKLILLIVFYFTFPLVIIHLCKRWTLFQKFGTIVIAYLFGLIIGSVGILPQGSHGYKMAIVERSVSKLDKKVLDGLISEGKAVPEDVTVNRIGAVQDNITTITILLAFPLLLFSLNMKRWLKYAKKGFLSVILALVAGIVMVTAGYFIWKNAFPDTWKLAGMFEGIYTGGTPNFAALKLMLNVDADRFVVLNTYDIIVGAFLVVFFITLAPRIFRAILPKFDEKDGASMDHELVEKEIVGLDNFSGMLKKGTILPLLKAFGLSLIITGIGVGLSFLVPPEYMPYKNAVAVLSITTLGIIASLFRGINRIEKTFQLGMYLILVFSLTVATMANLTTMFGKGTLDLILFISWCYFGSLFLHIILAKIFRIDADNFLITSTAFIFSPPFVPLVANALKNKDVIVTGIAGGVLGYILGNYFGFTLAHILERL